MNQFFTERILYNIPILKYPDPSKRFVVFTDVSYQAAATVLTWEYPDEDGKIKEIPLHTYQHSFFIHNSSGALLLKKDIQSIMQSRIRDTTLKMQKFY